MGKVAKESDYGFIFKHHEIIESILDSIQDGVFTVDGKWRIMSFNRGAEEMTGWGRMDAIGRSCAEVLGANACGERCAMKETLQTGHPVRDREVLLSTRSGERVPVSVSTAILKDRDGRFRGGVEIFRDLRSSAGGGVNKGTSNAFYGIVSKSPKIRRIFDILPEVAASEAPVLIQGESGTGKELFANVIHRLSPRCEGPLIKVNCGALPETLLESELFGYVKGAFTDARRDKPGRFQLAHEGTLFLDEIDELPTSTQVKLLRVLQNGEFEPLGSTRTSRTDVRIVAASHRDLETLMDQGVFREDLFYRIHVVKLEISPLRERKEDIPPLVHQTIQRFNQKSGKHVKGLTDDAFQALLQHDFPGNVRELENILEHAFVLCRDATILGLRHLPAYLPQSMRNGTAGDMRTASLEEMEKNAILEALRKHRWNRSKAAAELGIGRSTLWRKLKHQGIYP
jgi:PAS domain S-box-containing protein